jgi:hypothetical protein
LLDNRDGDVNDRPNLTNGRRASDKQFGSNPDLPAKSAYRQLRAVGRPYEGELAENVGGLNWSMQHHLIEMISFRGGVDETRETVWAFCGAADRHLEPLEGWRVVA